MQYHFMFRSLQTFSRYLGNAFLAAKRPVDLNQQDERLIIVRFEFGCALEKNGRAFEISLGEAGSSVKIMSLKTIGIESKGAFEF